MTRKVDVLVIGAGPGGYVAAIRVAQLGRQVLLVDRDKLGGECLHYGCIPSKALISAANLLERIRRAGELGIEVNVTKIDLSKLQAWKSSIVTRLMGGIVQLCKGNRVDVVHGVGKFLSARQVQIATQEGIEIVEASNVIIATGSRPVQLPGLELDGVTILGSREALELQSVPERLLVVGGGVIGLEIGTLYAKLGSHVTVVEILDQLLPGVDKDLVRVVQRKLEKLGVKVHLKSKVQQVQKLGTHIRVAIAEEQGEFELEVDKVLVSVGRRPNTEGLGLEEAGVAVDERGFIRVDRRQRTNIPEIHAIGDVAGPPFLAHKASREGIVAAEVIAGLPSEADYRALPDAVFTDPEIATVGLSESTAREKGHDYVVGRFPFSALGRALTAGESEGFVKVISEKEGGVILGVQIVGPDASGLISEAALAIEMGATAEDLALTIHPHPTLPESLMEAAEATMGKAIHVLRL